MPTGSAIERVIPKAERAGERYLKITSNARLKPTAMPRKSLDFRRCFSMHKPRKKQTAVVSSIKNR